MEQDLICMYRKNDPEAGMYKFLTEAYGEGHAREAKGRAQECEHHIAALHAFRPALLSLAQSRDFIIGSRSNACGVSRSQGCWCAMSQSPDSTATSA